MLVAALAFVGGTVGLVLKFYTTVSFDLLYKVNCISTLLMRALRCMSLLYICSSVVRVVANLPPLNLRNKVRLVLAVITTLISVTIGVMMVTWLIPGLDIPGAQPFFRFNAVGELLWNLVYGNPTRIQYNTYRDTAASSIQMLHSLESLRKQFFDWPSHYAIIIGLLLIGLFMYLHEPDTIPLLTVAVHDVSKHILCWIFKFLYVAAITHSVVFMYNTDWDQVIKLINFVGVVLLGLVIHGCVLLPLLYLWMVQKNPLTLMKRLLCTTGTSILFSFFPPADRKETTVDLMNGTMLYGAAVVLFINKFHALQQEMPQFFNMLTVLLLAALLVYVLSLAVVIICSVGTDGIPSIGPLTTFFLLSFLNLPLNAAGVLLIVEALLCMPIYLVNRMSAEFGEEAADCLAADDP